MRPLVSPGKEALARVHALANETLEPEEFLRRLAIPIGEAEEAETRSLVRWFRRRYPTPAERLAYCRRAYRRWTKAVAAARPEPLDR
jgi:hypothetical protein